MLALMLLAATTLPPRPSITLYGIEGGVSCANAWKPEFRQNSDAYLLGLWSGMNMEGKPSVGHSLGQNAALARIKAQCDREPTNLLINAALQVYRAARRQGE